MVNFSSRISDHSDQVLTSIVCYRIVERKSSNLLWLSSAHIEDQWAFQMRLAVEMGEKAWLTLTKRSRRERERKRNRVWRLRYKLPSFPTYLLPMWASNVSNVVCMYFIGEVFDDDGWLVSMWRSVWMGDLKINGNHAPGWWCFGAYILCGAKTLMLMYVLCMVHSPWIPYRALSMNGIHNPSSINPEISHERPLNDGMTSVPRISCFGNARLPI